MEKYIVYIIVFIIILWKEYGKAMKEVGDGDKKERERDYVYHYWKMALTILGYWPQVQDI